VIFLKAVDAAEANTIRVGIVQNLDRVAVEDGDDGTREAGGRGQGKKNEIETCQK